MTRLQPRLPPPVTHSIPRLPPPTARRTPPPASGLRRLAVLGPDRDASTPPLPVDPPPPQRPPTCSGAARRPNLPEAAARPLAGLSRILSTATTSARIPYPLTSTSPEFTIFFCGSSLSKTKTSTYSCWWSPWTPSATSLSTTIAGSRPNRAPTTVQVEPRLQPSSGVAITEHTHKESGGMRRRSRCTDGRPWAKP